MHSQANINKKRKRRLPASKSARSSSVVAFQNCSSEPMLSSEDAFSYVIARTEISGSNGQQQADEGERTGKANRSIRAQKLSVVRWSNVDVVPASGPKKIIGA